MAAHYADINCSQKNQNNQLFVDWIVRCIGYGPRYYALVLDGPETRTSRMLIRNGLCEKSTIYAPQIDDKDLKEMKRQNTCRTMKMTLSDAVNGIGRWSIPRDHMSEMKVFYFDYMGSAFGKKDDYREGVFKPKIYPLNDIIDALGQTQEKDIVVSITVCDRLGSKISTDKKFFIGREDFGEQLFKDFFVPVFQYTRFRTIEGGYYDYHRVQVPGDKPPEFRRVFPRPTRSCPLPDDSDKDKKVKPKNKSKSTKMWFFIFHLRKDRRLHPETVEFALNPEDGKEHILWGFDPDREDS